jgi:hypothetical protein
MAEPLLQTPPQKIVDEAGETVGIILAPDDFERIMDRLEEAYWERLVQERRHEPTRPAAEFWAELEAEEAALENQPAR